MVKISLDAFFVCIVDRVATFESTCHVHFFQLE